MTHVCFVLVLLCRVCRGLLQDQAILQRAARRGHAPPTTGGVHARRGHHTAVDAFGGRGGELAAPAAVGPPGRRVRSSEPRDGGERGGGVGAGRRRGALGGRPRRRRPGARHPAGPGPGRRGGAARAIRPGRAGAVRPRARRRRRHVQEEALFLKLSRGEIGHFRVDALFGLASCVRASW